MNVKYLGSNWDKYQETAPRLIHKDHIRLSRQVDEHIQVIWFGCDPHDRYDMHPRLSCFAEQITSTENEIWFDFYRSAMGLVANCTDQRCLGVTSASTNNARLTYPRVQGWSLSMGAWMGPVAMGWKELATLLSHTAVPFSSSPAAVSRTKCVWYCGHGES